MSPENQGVYIIPGKGDHGEEGWVAPEPAEKVIVEEVLAATDLSADAVEPLEDHVDFEDLSATLSGEGGDPLSFKIEGYAVSVAPDGTVRVTNET